MANHKGSEGTVKIGANVIAEVRSYSFEETMSPIEDTTLGDTTKTFQSGLTEWNGSVEAYWDETDTDGQGALTIGASVSLVFNPEGETSGDTIFTGTGLVTKINRAATLDGIVEVSFDFQGSGALVESTVT